MRKSGLKLVCQNDRFYVLLLCHNILLGIKSIFALGFWSSVNSETKRNQKQNNIVKIVSFRLVSKETGINLCACARTSLLIIGFLRGNPFGHRPLGTREQGSMTFGRRFQFLFLFFELWRKNNEADNSRMPLSANLFRLESLILTWAKRATNRNRFQDKIPPTKSPRKKKKKKC